MYRIKGILYLLTVILVFLVLCAAQASAKSRWNVTEEEYKETADLLFSDFVPDNEESKKVVNLYNSGKYEESLDAYRNYMMDKLCKIYWPFQDNYASNFVHYTKFTEPARYVVGEWDAQTLMTTHPSRYGNMSYFPNPELLGDPYTELEYNWPHGWADSYSSELGENVYNAPMNAFYHNVLTGFYFVTGNQIYLDKVMQIGSHYCKYGKDQAEEYKEKYDTVGKDYAIYFQMNNTVPVLQLQGLVTMYIQDFMLMSKYAAYDREALYNGLVNGDIAQTELKNLLELPVELEIPENEYEIIDSLKFAQIVNGIIYDFLPYIHENMSLSNFLISNVKVSALNTLMKSALIFDEFPSLKPMYDNAVKVSSEDLLKTSFLDGGFLEEHTNYMQSNYTTYMTQYMSLAGLGMDTDSELLTGISQLLERYRKFYVSICSPVGLMMPYGNSPLRGYDAIWKDEAALEKLRNSNGIHEVSGYKQKINESDRGYTSVYFPITGAMVMRKDWSIFTPMHFSMFTSARRGAGHRSANTNAVWLSAYGRNLICSGNVHWYSTTFAATHQLEEFNKYNEYFSENSTFKNSTVAVNGMSQMNVNIEKVQAPQAEQEIIEDMRWSSSDSFDFGEGFWDAGYGEGVSYVNQDHLRQAIYVKDANIVVVNDTLTSYNNNTNEYRQIWGFPEYLEGTTHTGFTDEQVIVDESDNSIYTKDLQGPNIFMSQYSAENIRYKKYYGSKDNDLEMYLGWGGNTYNTVIGRIPKADVHVVWHNSDNSRGSKSQMISVLAPTENTECPYEYKKDLSVKTKNISGFEMKMKNGTLVKYISSPVSSKLSLDNISGEAKAILLVCKGDTIKGIILDGKNVNINSTNGELGGSFEFCIADGNAEIVNQIAVPASFSWEMGDDGEYPSYGQGISEETASAIKELKNYEGQIVSLCAANSDDAGMMITKGITFIKENISPIVNSFDKDAKNEVLNSLKEIEKCVIEEGMEEEAKYLSGLVNSI